MVHPTEAASRPRRPRLAGLLSLGFHGGAIALLIALAGQHIVHSPPSKKVLVPVEVVQPAAVSAPAPPPRPPPVHAGPAARPGGASPSAGTRTRHEPVPRAHPVAPATVASLADLRISYEDPANFADHGPTTIDAASGAGLSGIGAAPNYLRADGIANIDIPQPATVSLARSPRPKHDYTNLKIPGASKFAGETVKLLLTIGTNGKVRGVRLLQGVDRELDQKTVALTRTFEYEPALDDAGVAIQGTSRWDIQIVKDEDGDMFESAREYRRR